MAMVSALASCKRELVTGDLRDRRQVALPAFAAVGGMVVPALIFVAFNAGGAGSVGWGIPMATDIAFAVGVMAVLVDVCPVRSRCSSSRLRSLMISVPSP